MVVSQAQRAETAVTQMLASAVDGSVAACDLRTALEMSRAIASKLAAFQARAAAVLATRDGHGDGGAGVLRHATGVSRRQAVGQARAVRVVDDMPLLREALEAGRVSFNNAARLAEVAEATSAGAVQADRELLANAESMPDDQFSREARRWAARQQPDGGEAAYARRRARRSLRIWDGDDGMTHLRGEFDPVTGERIRNRLEAEARRVRRADARDERRSFPQAMADALDGLTALGSDAVQGRGRARGRRGGPGGDSNDVPDRSSTGRGRQGPDDPGDDNDDVPDRAGRRDRDRSQGNGDNRDDVPDRSSTGRGRQGPDDPGDDSDDVPDRAGRRDRDRSQGNGDNRDDVPDRSSTGRGRQGPDDPGDDSDDVPDRRSKGRGDLERGRSRDEDARGSPSDGRNGREGYAVADSIHRGRPIADIAVVSYVDSETGDLVSQLATGEPLPPSVLEMLACNAAITGILYDTNGTPLWRGTTKRTATASQLKALIARDGGCVGCGCHPALCQAHHIKPASRGGPTTIANMVLLCWHCHHKVHHHQWQVTRRHGRFGLLPPVRTRWGPARAPDPPGREPGPGPSARPSTPSSALPAEPLFAVT